MRTADKVAEFLEENGIDTAFGIVGGGNIHLWDAITQRKYTKIVCVHHEQAAAQAAIGYYRTCGKVAVVLPTMGAGVSNTLTGIINAYMDSFPVLILSGQEATHLLKTNTRVWGAQDFDHFKVFGSVTKSFYQLTDNNAYKVLPEALADAIRPRMGPVWIDCPRDVQQGEQRV